MVYSVDEPPPSAVEALYSILLLHYYPSLSLRLPSTNYTPGKHKTLLYCFSELEHPRWC
jgi:hypothetical protein